MKIFIKMTKHASKIYQNSHYVVKNGVDIIFAFMFFAATFNYLRQDNTKSTNQIYPKECFGRSTMKSYTYRQKGTME